MTSPSVGMRNPGSPSPDVPSSSLVRWLGLTGVVLAIVGFVAHAAMFWHYVNDDAYITFRYSRFLAMGRGPYYNVGEHVEGYTNFLLMLLLAPVSALGGPEVVPAAAKIIGIACGATAVLATALAVKAACRVRAVSPGTTAVAAFAAAALVATSPAFALNAASGLETSMMACCVSVGAWLGMLSVESGRWRGAGVAFALGTITRPEGQVVFAAYWLAQLLAPPAPWRLVRDAGWAGLLRQAKFSRHLLPDAAIVVAVTVAHHLFRWLAYDGELFPNTYHAKASGFWKLDAGGYVIDGLLPPLLGAIGAVVAGVGWLWPSKWRAAALPLLSVGLVGGLLPLLTGADWMLGSRLIQPYVPLVCAAAALGWMQLTVALLRQPSWLGPGLVLAAVTSAWWLHSAARAEYVGHTRVRAYGYHHGHNALANWLKGAAKPGDTIALMDIGIVGYECIDQSVLDITGLTDRFIAKSPGAFLRKEYDPSYVLDKKPAFVVIVFGMPGNPSVAPASLDPFRCWSTAEERLFMHPEFQAHYARKASPDGARTWQQALGARVGAAAVFEHLQPGAYYLLGVFPRRE